MYNVCKADLTEGVIVLGYRVRECREAKGMTQAELAEKSGVSRVAISLIETGGIRNVSSLTLMKLADALGVSVDYLFFTDSGKPV